MSDEENLGGIRLCLFGNHYIAVLGFLATDRDRVEMSSEQLKRTPQNCQLSSFLKQNQSVRTVQSVAYSSTRHTIRSSAGLRLNVPNSRRKKMHNKSILTSDAKLFFAKLLWAPDKF